MNNVCVVKLRFYYNAMGNRVVKENLINNTKEIYIRDAQGNVIAVYEIKKKNNIDSLFTNEFHIFGSNRLGYLMDKKYLARKTYGKTLGGAIPALPVNPIISIPNPFLLLGTTSITPIYFGNKRYELTDWLGNVRVVINDKKTPVNTGTTTVSYFPQVVSVSDYYSFGLDITERSYSHTNTKYRFSFNDKEDIEQRWYQDYGARYYHKALGRFISADPLIVKQKQYAWLSSYQFASNTPIWAIDRDGLEAAYKKPDGGWVTAGDKLQRKISAEELKAIQNRFPQNASAPQSAGERLVEGFINPFVIVSTSIVMPIVNQVYTTAKEGLHPGTARDKKNQLDWAVPYKLENWQLKPLKQNISATFEGKEGYERGGKEVIDATVDVIVSIPIEPKNALQRGVKLGVEYGLSESIKRIINKVYDSEKNKSKNKNNQK